MRRFGITLIVMFSLIFSALAQDGLDTDELEFLLDDYVFEADPAVVLYVRYEDEEWVGVRGLTDIDNGTPAATDDLFRIGSVTKTFVATIMLQLVDEGEIALDDPIADYLPDDIVNNVENADTATVRQILQMTSGIFSYTESTVFDDLVASDSDRWWTAEETIETIYGEAADFPAGDGYYYSNSNYNLAQIIIEGITGDSLATVLDDRIFAPVGMDSCYLETEAVFAQDMVRGYQFDDDGEPVDVTAYNDGVGLGDGGIVCNAKDLAKFLPAIERDLLPEAMINAMLDTVADGDGGAYGLGIASENDGDFGWIVGHDGATSGFQSNMVMLPDEDMVVVILTNNFDSDLIEDLTYDAIAVAFGDY